VRRFVLTLIAVLLFAGGYMQVNRLLVGTPARTLGTEVDRMIPFWPPAELIYIMVYLFILLPVVQVRCPRVLTRVATGYYAYNLVAIFVFWYFPVRYERPPAFAIESLTTWGVALNYFLDPPYNCFPSLHVANSVFASAVAWRIDRRVGWVASVFAVAISLSTMLVKQHYLADVLSGAALGFAGYRMFARPAILERAPLDEMALPRRYPLVLPSIYLMSVAALSIAYSLGWRPFP